MSRRDRAIGSVGGVSDGSGYPKFGLILGIFIPEKWVEHNLSKDFFVVIFDDFFEVP